MSKAETAWKIDFWQEPIRGAVSVRRALNLADSFTEACAAGEPVPSWALALRALARRVRIQAQALAKKANK